MKSIIPMVVAALVGIGGGYLIWGRQSTPPPVTTAGRAPAEIMPTGKEKVIFKFTDDEKLREFATLWQRRQGLLVRMAMLQGYWGDEQAKLNELNTQLNAQYSVDTAKNYTLDSDRKVLLERPETPPGPDGQPQAQPPETSGPEKIVHTFADEPAMRTFAELWQQRQALIVRMAVLQSYWENDNQVLQQLNGQLSSDYKVDVTKDYIFDGQRKVLLEREPAPGGADGAAPGAPAAPTLAPGSANSSQPDGAPARVNTPPQPAQPAQPQAQ
jgi:hypothetical protein